MSQNKLPLIIKATKAIDAKETAKWNPFDDRTNYIKDIDTLAAGDKKTHKIGNLISGVPTPWARPTIFRYAIEASGDELSPGLKEFYNKIKIEWKALIACIALYKDKITIKKVELKPPTSSDDLARRSDFKGRAGLMLFDDIHFWTDPEAPADENPPYLQFIKIETDKNKQVLLGATSPFSLVFTPPKVQVPQNHTIKFLDPNGNWINPCDKILTAEELQNMYDCVTYIKDHLVQYQQKINRDKNEEEYGEHVKLEVGALNGVLEEFQQEILDYETGGRTIGRRVEQNNLYDAPQNFFATPFDTIFNAESKLYQEGDKFYKQPGAGREEVKIKEFLAPSKDILEVIFNKDNGEDPKRCTAHLLPVKTRDADNFVSYRYFAMPFSSSGILFFQHTLRQLISPEENAKNHHIYAELVDRGRMLKVTLSVKFFLDKKNNEPQDTKVEKYYRIEEYSSLSNEKIIVWPDFIANEWESYYLYSNLPHNRSNSEIKAFPLLGEIKPSSVNIKLRQGRMYYIEHDDTQKEQTNVDEVKMLVKHPINSQSDNIYEIYESKLPFVGIELRVGTNDPQVAGYLITQNIDESDEAEELRLSRPKRSGNLAATTVGVDFGSNNTCISYYTSGGDKSLSTINLSNRRRFFLGSDKKIGSNNKVAKAYELFFFQKEPTNGELKSMMIAHDRDRLEKDTASIPKPVRGGFPMLEKNLPISGIPSKNKEHNYEIKIRRSKALIKYNMKWSDDIIENDYKKAFLKTLWLQIYAELFVQNYKPQILRWAYPAAMENDRIDNYESIWETVVQDVNPLRITKGTEQTEVSIEKYTEGEAVARYAIQSNTGKLHGGKLAVNSVTLGIGYDVGGSTTDILMLMQLNQNDSTTTVSNTSLVQQSSILLAAQALAKTAQVSKKIRETLINFLDEENISIYGINKMTSQTAPYYLNAVFDRLSKKQLFRMYRYFHLKNCKEIFAIVSYVTGLILYYTGQLAARVIEDHDEQGSIQQISKGFYGKGGNIFNWISVAMPSTSRQYYEKCFFKGLGKSDRNRAKMDELEEELSQINKKLQTQTVNISQTVTTSTGSNDSINSPEYQAELENNQKLSTALKQIKDLVKTMPSLATQVQETEAKLDASNQKIAMLKTGNVTTSPELAKLQETLNKLKEIYLIMPNPAIQQQIDNVEAQVISLQSNGNSSLSSQEIAEEQAKQKQLKDALQKLTDIYLIMPNPAIQQQIDNTKKELVISEQKLAGGSISANSTATSSSVPYDLESLKTRKEAIEAELEHLASIQLVKINPDTKYLVNQEHNKREVSYGLSSDRPIHKPPKEKHIPEIIGEEGYIYDGKELSFTSAISAQYLRDFSLKFQYPKRFKKLEEFVDIYCEFALDNNLLDIDPIRERVVQLSLTDFQGYVEDIPQYKTALKGRKEKFDFKTPMIILEGMCLLDNVIFKQCFPQDS